MFVKCVIDAKIQKGNAKEKWLVFRSKYKLLNKKKSRIFFSVDFIVFSLAIRFNSFVEKNQILCLLMFS
jgi:hypothetical protein